MNRISGANNISKSLQNTTASANQNKLTASAAANTQNASSNTDRVELSGSNSAKDLTALSQSFIENLKNLYPSINILAGNSKLPTSAIATGMGTGTHLIISSDFFSRMSGSKEEFKKCSKALNDIARQLSHNSGKYIASGAYMKESGASVWSVKPAVSSSEKQPSLFTISSSKKKNTGSTMLTNSSYNVMKHHSGIARARSKSQVQLALSDIQKSITNLRIAALSSDTKTAVKASRALKSLKKLLTRGSRKIKQLSKEELTQLKQKKLQQKMEEEKAELARNELRKLRSKRYGEENSILKDGQAAEAYIRGYANYRSMKSYTFQEIAFSAIDASSVSIPSGCESFTSADVVVSDVSY